MAQIKGIERGGFRRPIKQIKRDVINGSSKKPEIKESSENSENLTVDRYGFILTKEEEIERLKEINSDEHRLKIRKEKERLSKWLHMRENWELYINKKKSKLKSRIRKGIPTAIRADIWKRLTGVSLLSNIDKKYYHGLLLKKPHLKAKQPIDNDLDRTFPKHALFNTKFNKRGKSSLKNVLYAFAVHDPVVGYTQGMGFIAALLLMLMTEDDAFFILKTLLDSNGDYKMRGLYMEGLPELHLRYYQFNKLLIQFAPKIHKHLVKIYYYYIAIAYIKIYYYY